MLPVTIKYGYILKWTAATELCLNLGLISLNWGEAANIYSIMTGSPEGSSSGSFYCPIVSVSYLVSVICLWIMPQCDISNFPIERDQVSSHCSLVIVDSFKLDPFISSICIPNYSPSVKKERTQEVRVNGDREAMFAGGWI